MTREEAKAILKAEGRLPPHLGWLLLEAQRVMRVTDLMIDGTWGADRFEKYDTQAYCSNFASLTPQHRETINMALVARLAQACRMLVPWTAPVLEVRAAAAA
jgi:hypothetical protein